MEDERFREGETIEFTLTDTDETAETAMLTISQDGAIVKQAEGTFAVVDTVNMVTVRVANNDLAIGDYDYMFTIEYSDGFIAKIPNSDDCDGEEDCALPVLTICDANDIEGSS